MSLEIVKDLFEEATGRHDLIVSTGNFNALWLINQGIRWLEKTYTLKNMRAKYKVDLAVGTFYVRLNPCMSIHEVFVADSLKERSELTVRTRNYIYTNYGEDFTEVTNARPSDYSPTVERAASSTQNPTYENYSSDVASMKDYNGILILAPADEVYTLIVDGDFFSESLVEGDEDVSNFWTENSPMAVALAASLQLDKIYRNKEGVTASRAAIFDDIEGDLKAEHFEEAYTATEGNG